MELNINSDDPEDFDVSDDTGSGFLCETSQFLGDDLDIIIEIEDAVISDSMYLDPDNDFLT